MKTQRVEIRQHCMPIRVHVSFTSFSHVGVCWTSVAFGVAIA